MSMYQNNSALYGCEGEVQGNIPRAEGLVYITFLFTQLALSGFGNALVCTAIIRFHHLQTLANVFIFSLAITDILTPLMRLLYIALSLIKNRWIFGCVWCKLSSVLGVFLCAASILHLCAISVERFVVIRYPLRHHQFITRKRITVAIILIWITALLLSLMPYFDFVEMKFNSDLLDCEIDWSHKPYLAVLLLIFFFMVPFLIMTCTYYFIFQEVHRQTRRVSVLTISKSRTNNKVSRLHRQSKVRQELKAVKIVIVVIGVFFVLWLPFFVVTSVRAYLPNALSPSWVRLVLGLAYLNSSCNWIIYSVMNKTLRNAFKKLITSCNSNSKDLLHLDSSRKMSVAGDILYKFFRRSSSNTKKYNNTNISMEASAYIVPSDSNEKEIKSQDTSKTNSNETVPNTKEITWSDEADTFQLCDSTQGNKMTDLVEEKFTKDCKPLDSNTNIKSNNQLTEENVDKSNKNRCRTTNSVKGIEHVVENNCLSLEKLSSETDTEKENRCHDMVQAVCTAGMMTLSIIENNAKLSDAAENCEYTRTVHYDLNNVGDAVL